MISETWCCHVRAIGAGGINFQIMVTSCQWAQRWQDCKHRYGWRPSNIKGLLGGSVIRASVFLKFRIEFRIDSWRTYLRKVGKFATGISLCQLHTLAYWSYIKVSQQWELLSLVRRYVSFCRFLMPLENDFSTIEGFMPSLSLRFGCEMLGTCPVTMVGVDGNVPNSTHWVSSGILNIPCCPRYQVPPLAFETSCPGMRLWP